MSFEHGLEDRDGVTDGKSGDGVYVRSDKGERY